MIDILSISTITIGFIILVISLISTFRYSRYRFGEYSLPISAFLIIFGAVITLLNFIG